MNKLPLNLALVWMVIACAPPERTAIVVRRNYEDASITRRVLVDYRRLEDLRPADLEAARATLMRSIECADPELLEDGLDEQSQVVRDFSAYGPGGSRTYYRTYYWARYRCSDDVR
ncbi:MAG: hypothetical protein H7A21_12590 [Spirochaetales bacterium]|nr:hypothetical protein [Leptospiraceae bacterium]MCP5482267.1 hypothetical protein [Spirochaetales bacterium]MCP5484621.1 hypothetical protein [Spirochaetales bacterium]